MTALGPTAGEVVDLGDEHVVARRDGSVLWVRIDRPAKRNAMTQGMYRAVKRAAVTADGDPSLDVVVLTGTGDCFCVGGDMSGEGATEGDLASEWDPTDHFPFRHLERCRAVVVAAVNGRCHAGGLNLVLYSDVVVATPSATFRAPELARGIPDPWIAARLPAHTGVGPAKELLFTGRQIDATEAHALGIVGRVASSDDAFASTVDDTVTACAALAPEARREVKTAINATLAVPDASMFGRSIMGPEMAEGFAAFLERRDPQWPR